MLPMFCQVHHTCFSLQLFTPRVGNTLQNCWHHNNGRQNESMRVIFIDSMLQLNFFTFNKRVLSLCRNQNTVFFIIITKQFLENSWIMYLNLFPFVVLSDFKYLLFSASPVLKNTALHQSQVREHDPLLASHLL